MRLGFMSSVCPEATLAELIDTARKFGYTGIEFRTEWGHRHGIELDLGWDARREVRQRMLDEGITPICLATSVCFNASDPAEREAQQEMLRRYIVLAAEIGARYVRTFGDPLPTGNEEQLERTLRAEARSYSLVNDWAETHGIGVLLETHGNMRADYARRVIKLAHSSNLYILWHIGHHIRHGQSVDEAYSLLRWRIRHVHFSAMPDKVTTDEDNRRSFELLAAQGFDGFFSVEVINPPDPESTLRLHREKYETFMAAAQSTQQKG